MSNTPALGKILIVDEDSNIADLLCVNLRSEGYQVDAIPQAAEAMRLDLSDTNLVIADAMRQDFDGMQLLAALKDNPMTAHVGFILMSSDDSERRVIEALDNGADDYVVKPFSLREFVARIRSVLRRHNIRARVAPSTRLTYQTLTVDLSTRMVTDDGMELPLSRTEYLILVLLLKNVGVPTSRREIFNSVWKDSPEMSNDRIVDTNISRLRKKLGDVGSNIQNRSGLGYLFVRV
ncbi:MAG: response regulator transcription factor [Muribaculaceae bacterium]|nr:response regulator transcription factor [Muribaculaceae bacterium]